jgi:hypothetical protein
MSLTDEERARIYEEEKARVEARELAEKGIKKKKPWTFMRVVKYGVVLFFGIPIGFGILGAIFSGSKDAKTTATNTEAVAPAESSNIVTIDYNGKPKKAALVEETIHLVEKVEHRRSIGNQFMSTDADGEFLIVRLLVRNDSKETRTIGASQMEVIDAAGREFRTSSEGSTALTMSGDKSAEFLMSEVQPGLEKRISIVFDVPPGSKNLKLKVPSGGFGEAAILPL